MKLSRRGFLKGLGVGAVAATGILALAPRRRKKPRRLAMPIHLGQLEVFHAEIKYPKGQIEYGGPLETVYLYGPRQRPVG